MAQSRTLRKIGAKLREESRGIVEAKLPERLRVLVDRLACVEEHQKLETATSRVDRSNDNGSGRSGFPGRLH